MNVYEVMMDLEDFLYVAPLNIGDTRKFDRCPLGISMKNVWQPFVCRYLTAADIDDFNPKVVKGSFIGIAGLGGFALAEKAVQLAGDLFLAYGELLPINIEKSAEVVHFFHNTNIVNAFDEKNGVVKRYTPPLESRIMSYVEYAFFPEKVGDNQLFQITDYSVNFCTEPFKQKIEALGLTGLYFWLRWSDEPAGIAYLKEQRLLRMGGPSAAVN
jgi:hypothetical protein